MTISRREGPFVAEITGDLLSVHRSHADERWGMGSGLLTGRGVSMLFLCSLRRMPWFVMHGDGLYAQNDHDALTPLYRGEDADQLLCCISSLLTTAESKRLRSLKRRKYGYAAVAVFLTGCLLSLPVFIHSQFPLSGAGLLTTVDAPRGALPVRGPALPAPAVPSPAMTVPAQQSPAERWGLPLNVRAELPGKLKNAASRGLFTVPLSSGHARTLYVFADPACPNCQRMERHFETAAGTVNVVIFPVTIEGGKSSLDALTPVMALPEADRPAAWKQLFAVDTGIGVPGGAKALPAVTDEKQAEMARGAIGVNEVAFRAYRLPGTPWTISDDGRYVPQGVLSSPAALADFLNGGGHDGQ